jgi:Protein of unknown function (DUF2975)
MNLLEIILLLVAFICVLQFRWQNWRAGSQQAAAARLARIRMVARFFKWICLAGFGLVIYAAGVAIFLPGMVADLGDQHRTALVNGPFILAEFKPGLKWMYPVCWILLAAFFGRGIGFFYQLFRNMERGSLFDRDNVHYVRLIGWWLVACAFLGVIVELIKFVCVNDSAVPAVVDLSHLGADVLRGFFVIFIAWIMDEGRKISEEQALTV